ncbi:MAG: carbohydrate ABC transporter permease [Acetatifactor sp.]|nr:carbohydrate ABC transporter permease [Acetatifactor sp.]
MKTKTTADKIISYSVLILMVALILYPLMAIFLSAFKTMSDFMGNPLGIPKTFTVDNFVYAWSKMHFGTYTANSVLVSSLTVALVCVLGAMAGYKLSFNFKGNKLIFTFFLAGMAVPVQSYIITLFQFMKKMKLLSSYPGLILVYTAINLPFAIFIFSSFFKTVPRELSEAAQVDGCSEMRTFAQILIPISKPTLATVVIVTMMNVWNDFFVQMIINMDQKKYTLPMGLLKFRSETSVNWTPLFASIILVALPVAIVFVLLQKQFIKGLTNGAVKG